MAWTTPKTYSVGDVLTASDMNSYQRDNLSAAFPTGTTGQTYVPALTASTTDPTLGTGSTQTGRWYRVGQLVIAHALVQFGSSGAAAGSGTYELSLPVTASGSGDTNAMLGAGELRDSSQSPDFVAIATLATGDTTKCNLRYDSGGGAVTNSAPFTWAANDLIRVQFTYEAA